jgi:purine-binding chemotaxis protein CheW
LASIERPADPEGGDEPPVGAVRYLVAQAAAQRVAFRIDAVREIIPAREATRLPGAEAWVLGLLNLRGTVLTVVDLTVRFGGASAAGANIVVLEEAGRAFGVQVERVYAVTDVADVLVTAVEEARSAGGLASGLVPVPGGTALVLDVTALARAALADA